MNKRTRELVFTLVGLSVECMLLAGGLLYLAYHVHSFMESRNTITYIMLPFLLIVGLSIACVNIHAYYHPEQNEEEEE